MPWNHIWGPTQGQISNIPSSLIPKFASTYVKGCYLKQGEIHSDFGYLDYPSAGLLKTNKLNGSVMKVENFKTIAGLEFFIALTTTNVYQYNTSITTWDCITQGATVEDCEDAWVANANVTSTADASVKLRGTNSSKNVIADAFTTGIAAYENFSSADFSTYTYLHLWVYTSVAVAAADMSIRISEENAGGTGADYEDVDIPAIAVDTWTPVCVAFTGATTKIGRASCRERV